jgi:hypothetical protein
MVPFDAPAIITFAPEIGLLLKSLTVPVIAVWE